MACNLYKVMTVHVYNDTKQMTAQRNDKQQQSDRPND